MIGKSQAMHDVFDLIQRIAKPDINVLITGETGSGKELAARAIHGLSSRRKGPFLAVNCAGITDTLLESELFGHEKGAFTGAVGRKKGKFELANSGVLFLDEIGDMSMSAQAKILRAIEDRKFQLVGGEETITVDVRIVAATNQDLTKAVAQGEFRDDLFHRLNEMHITVPPLRGRKEDIPLLVNHFLKQLQEQYDISARRVSGVSMNYLMQYRWPGNVRELKNVVKRAGLLCDAEEIWLDRLPIDMLFESQDEAAGEDPDHFPTLAETEARHVRKALLLAKWNKVKASGMLGVSRPRLDRKIRLYKITKPDL
jgi:two-component system NtrC family response regulator